MALPYMDRDRRRNYSVYAAAGEGELMTRVSISEARRRLPGLVRELREDHGSVVQITVRDEVVAELRAVVPDPQPEPGAAARALLELMRKLPKRRGRRRNISGHVKEHLYGRKA